MQRAACIPLSTAATDKLADVTLPLLRLLCCKMLCSFELGIVSLQLIKTNLQSCLDLQLSPACCRCCLTPRRKRKLCSINYCLSEFCLHSTYYFCWVLTLLNMHREYTCQRSFNDRWHVKEGIDGQTDILCLVLPWNQSRSDHIRIRAMNLTSNNKATVIKIRTKPAGRTKTWDAPNSEPKLT